MIGSLDVVRVKSYAPKWDHVVYDIVKLDGREGTDDTGVNDLDVRLAN